MQLAKTKQLGILHITREEIHVEVRDHDKLMVKHLLNTFRKGALVKEIREHAYLDFYNQIGGKRRRDKMLEDKMSFVPMAYGFYFYLVNVGHIPSIETFCNFFLNSFCEEVDCGYRFKENYSNKPEYVFEKEALFGKICRAYNSFIREFLLLTTLYELQNKESYKDMEIFYDADEDINGGADIVIKANGKTYALLITQNSNHANYYNAKKRDYRHAYNYDECVYVKLSEDETEDIGDCKIFTKKTAKNILDQIKEKSTTN